MGHVSGIQGKISHSQFYYTPSAVDQLGYKPIIGSVVGVVRVLAGVIHAAINTIVLLGSILFKGDVLQRAKDLGDSLGHVIRGAVEVIPILGGLITRVYDHVKMTLLLEHAQHQRASKEGFGHK